MAQFGSSCHSIPLTPETQASDYPLAFIPGGLSTSWMTMVSAFSYRRELKGRSASCNCLQSRILGNFPARFSREGLKLLKTPFRRKVTQDFPA
jgi:hypothetical protein